MVSKDKPHKGPRDLVVLTGAGISAESGVPTFRGSTGLWENRRPQELATPEAFHADPKTVWRFYHWRRALVADCSPNSAHDTLAEMERELGSFQLITQNVDGLHQQAGNLNVLELHGSLWEMKCSQCGDKWQDRRVRDPKPLPKCPQCAGLARPNVVWFGEELDPQVLLAAREVSLRAATMLVVGTSGIVHPAAELPLLAASGGATLIEFNVERTVLSKHMDQVHIGKAGETLPHWWKARRGRSA
jgi:NAD-dependent deacetylase